MKKVFVSFKFNEVQKQRLESISPELEFVYEPDEEASVIIGNYDTQKLKDFKRLEWMQTGAIGVEKYIQEGVLPEGVTLTNAVDIHTREVAEHVLAVIMTMIKKLYLYRDDQHAHRWSDENQVKEIGDLKAAIVGFGNIGKCLAKMLKSLGAYTIGVKREMIIKPDYLDELYLQEDLNKAISDVDVVVTLIPGYKENVHLFTLDTFKAMRPDTILVNAGRGNLYSEETLKTVLDTNIIRAVASDVFEDEPLAEDSELWDYPNLLITPHIAGSYHLESAREAFVDLVAENLERYVKGETLKYIVEKRD